MSFRCKLTVTAAFVFAFLSLSAGVASAQNVVLISKLGAKCLDAEGGRTASGTRLIGYACNGQSNQTFEFHPDGTIRQAGKCVDASSGQGKDGDQIQLWDCNGGRNQKWSLSGGRLVGINGKCMDLKGGSGWWMGNQPAILYSCNGQDNQSWYKGVKISASRVKGVPVVNPGAMQRIQPVNASASVIAAGGGNVITAGGGNVIAAGGGNVIAAGGGNVIAAGGGNVIVPARD